jgi:thiamine-monophosphate kinase
MRIEQIGEFGLIELIRKAVSKKTPEVILGIGDDAAVFKTPKTKWNLATVDSLVEGVHFDRRFTDFETLGWKSLAVNISDIAAMGGNPRWALLNLTLTESISTENVMSLCRGIKRCADRFHTRVIGGNISRAHADFSVTVTMLGEVSPKYCLRRSGAKVGDVIAVTGDVGAAHAGLKVLQSSLDKKLFPHSVRKHLTPTPRNRWIAELLRNKIRIHSCIDLSDGFVSDLHHVCEASRVGAELRKDQIPIHEETKRISELMNENALDYALHGGEDYELAITLTKAEFRKAKSILKKNLTVVGLITKTKRIIGISSGGEKAEILPTGFKHF